MLDLNIGQLRQKLQRYPLQQAYLFGSYARGTAGPLSDVDIALLFKSRVNKDKIESKIFADISQLLHTDNIDIIDIETASPLLAHRSVIQGVPLLNHSRHEEAVLKTSILHSYEDSRYLRELKARAAV
ncbi:MAG: nucleotidyltransferase domain-containing protein [Patescibacteria group bacterium]